VLVVSDLHWRCDTPSWRKEENYAAQVLRPQLASLLDAGEPVIVAGDVFHRAADFAATYDLFTFLKERGAVLYAVRGQHDMTLHSKEFEETGFNLLAKAGLIAPLGAKPCRIDALRVCGMGWGEDVPACNADVLIAHVSVSHGDAIIPGATTATAFRQKASAFQLVFTGDNHKRFCIRDEEFSGLYNAGCFHQMTDDLADQPPAAWRVIDGEVRLWPIPHKPPMVDESYLARKDKGRVAAAGVEFATALAEARSKGGGDVFLSTLKKAEPNVEDAGARELLKGLIKLCEEAHT